MRILEMHDKFIQFVVSRNVLTVWGKTRFMRILEMHVKFIQFVVSRNVLKAQS